MKKKEINLYRPYVYKRAASLGIPIVDGKRPIKIFVRVIDVKEAKKANSKHCALARSALRMEGVLAAYFFRSMAFLEYKTHMVRFALPPSVQKEIVAFDRAEVFAEGMYQLSPPPPSSRLRTMRTRHRKSRAEARRTKKRMRVTMSHIGNRTVSGIQSHKAPQPLPALAPSKYIHRTKYVRDLREPKD